MFKKLRLYGTFISVSIRMKMAHRGAFIAGFIGQFLSYGASFLTTYVMLTSFTSLGGWTAEQVLFLYGFNLVAYALAGSVFFTPSKSLVNKVRSGDFDASLTKPLHPLVHELFLGFNPGYISHASLGLLVMILSARGAGMSFAPGNLLLFLVMLMGAACLHGALLLLQSVGSFYFIRSNPLAMLSFMGRRFVEYPITIYSRAVQILLTFVLPFAFLNFFPASVVLGQEGLSPFPAAVRWFSPLVGAGLLALSIFLWNHSLSKYQSTGS